LQVAHPVLTFDALSRVLFSTIADGAVMAMGFDSDSKATATSFCLQSINAVPAMATGEDQKLMPCQRHEVLLRIREDVLGILVHGMIDSQQAAVQW
jgi:hypothetical protein